jgi:hypothetical protein
MAWMIKALRRGTVIDVTIVNPDPGEPIGPFVIRSHPPLPETPVRVESVGDGAGHPQLTLTDEAYQALYVTAELLNELELVKRIRSTEVT